MEMNIPTPNEEQKSYMDEIEYPFEFAGCVVYKDKCVCKKCGKEIERGIIPLSLHWNECIDENQTLNALMKAREEKGSELTVGDLDEILPKTHK